MRRNAFGISGKGLNEILNDTDFVIVHPKYVILMMINSIKDNIRSKFEKIEPICNSTNDDIKENYRKVLQVPIPKLSMLRRGDHQL